MWVCVFGKNINWIHDFQLQIRAILGNVKFVSMIISNLQNKIDFCPSPLTTCLDLQFTPPQTTVSQKTWQFLLPRVSFELINGSHISKSLEDISHRNIFVCGRATFFNSDKQQLAPWNWPEEEPGGAEYGVTYCKASTSQLVAGDRCGRMKCFWTSFLSP